MRANSNIFTFKQTFRNYGFDPSSENICFDVSYIFFAAL